jgi:hypothetical protein
MLALSVLSVILAIPLFFNLNGALANVHKRNEGFNRKRHVGRAEGMNGTSLDKRIDGRFSYYVAGLGACGQTNSAADYVSCMRRVACYSIDEYLQIVALNSAVRIVFPLHMCPRLTRFQQFSSGDYCGKTITIEYNGITAEASIEDEVNYVLLL